MYVCEAKSLWRSVRAVPLYAYDRVLLLAPLNLTVNHMFCYCTRFIFHIGLRCSYTWASVDLYYIPLEHVALSCSKLMSLVGSCRIQTEWNLLKHLNEWRYGKQIQLVYFGLHPPLVRSGNCLMKQISIYMNYTYAVYLSLQRD